jgi:adenylate kinase family enzyme
VKQDLRINVVGPSSSGKTTLSRKLSRILSIPHIEMDALFWGPNWYLPPNEEFLPKLQSALKGSSWILDGNYTNRTLSIKWERVTSIIWLDFSFPRLLYQAVIRAFKRIITQEELWSGTGNRETLKNLFSKDSIVLWTIKTYKKFRPFYKIIIESGNYSHIKFVRLSSPKEVDLFLMKVKNNRDLIFNKTISWRNL